MTAQEDSLSQMETDRLLGAEREKEALRVAADERRWADHTADITGRWAAANNLHDERWRAHFEIHRVHSETLESKFQAHKNAHAAEAIAVKTALTAVGELAALHNIAHTREHTAHETRHEDQREALRKAEMTMDKRLETLNGYQSILRDQQTTFISRDLSEEKHAEKEKRIEVLSTDINRRFEETRTRYEENRLRIETLEKGDVKQEGKQLGTAALAAIIVGSVSFVGAILSVIILMVNFIV
jgi:hypothetical protein